jgi:hypothetical protein
VQPRGPQRAADSDLTSPLGDGRQHDVHNPDAADQQRDRGDQAHHQHEHQPRDASLFQKFLGHHDRDVLAVPFRFSRPVLFRIAANSILVQRQAQRDADQISGLTDVLYRIDAERDLIQLNDLGTHRTAPTRDDEIADPLPQAC